MVSMYPTEYIPKEKLYDKFIEKVIKSLFPTHQKRKRRNEPCYDVIDSNGTTHSFYEQTTWNKQINHNSSFPICFVKREMPEGNHVFYASTGYITIRKNYALLVRVYQFQFEKGFKEFNRVYYSNGSVSIDPDLDAMEFRELEREFRWVFSQDPEYRLWAVTSDIFSKKEEI